MNYFADEINKFNFLIVWKLLDKARLFEHYLYVKDLYMQFNMFVYINLKEKRLYFISFVIFI